MCAALLAASCGKNEAAKEEPKELPKELHKVEEKVPEKAPDTFKVKFETSKGDFVVQVQRGMAPLGADRFHDLVVQKFFDGDRFFRVLKGFVVQFGLNGSGYVNSKWKDKTIADDPVKATNARGTIVFATSGPNSRTTQLFINLANNANLDGMGFAPFGRVTQGMEVVDSLYGGYGEGAPRGAGPDQQMIEAKGNAYLEEIFPKLDYVKKATIVE